MAMPKTTVLILFLPLMLEESCTVVSLSILQLQLQNYFKLNSRAVNKTREIISNLRELF